MKKITRILIVFIFFSNLYAQKHDELNSSQKIVDSLKAILVKTKSDSLKCIYNYKLADEYAKANKFKEYNFYRKNGNKYVLKNKFLKDISIFYNATYYDFKNKYDLYLNKLIVANNNLKKYNLPEIYSLRARIIRNQAVCYQYKNNEKKGFDMIVNQALPLAKKGNNIDILATMYFTIGVFSFNNENYKNAEIYYQKSIELYGQNKVSSPKYLIDSYLKYSHVLAINNKKNNALNTLDKAKKIFTDFSDLFLESSYYNEVAYLNHHFKDYKMAIINYDKAIEIAMKLNDVELINTIKITKSNTLTELNKISEAKDLLVESLNSKEVLISTKNNILKELGVLSKKLKDYPESVKYYEAYIKLNDSLDEVSVQKTIANLDAKYHKSENENKIRQLESEKQKAQLVSENNKLHYTLLVLLTFILSSIILFLWKNSKTQRLLTEEKEKNYSQNISTLKTQKEIEVMQAMIDGEEIERKRIARELHDGIGSKLSALKILISRFDNHKISDDSLSHFNELLSTSISELRQVSYNLVPESLLKLGLENALSDLCHLLHSETVKIEFQAFDITNTIPISSQMNIYRIIQELLNNALKHSQCSEILVSYSQNEGSFFISVEDNGNGFDVSSIDYKTGLGIKNLKSRVELLSGTYNLESNESGTYYNIELKI